LKWYIERTDDIWCRLDQIYIAIFIRNDLTGNFHDQFEVLCGLEEMIDDDVMTWFDVICGLEEMIYNVVMTKLKVYVDWKECEKKISRQIWDNICIVTYLKGCWHDLVWGDMWIGTDVKLCCHDLIWISI
jgi:hypothetical protein